MGNLNTDFGVSLSVTSDTSQAGRIIERFKQDVEREKPIKLKTKVEIETQKAVDLLKNYEKDALKTYNIVNTQVKTNTTLFKENGNAIKGVTKLVATYKNALGDIKQVTQYSKGDNKGLLGKDVTQIANGIKSITTEITKANDKFGEFNSTVTTTTKTILDTAGNKVQEVKTKVTEFVDAENKMHTITETLNGDGQQIAPTIEKITANVKKLNTEAQKTQEATKTLTETTKVINTVTGDVHTRIEETDKNGKKLITTISEINDKANGTVTVTKQVTDAEGKLISETKNVNTTLTQTKKAYDSVNSKAKTFGSIMINTIEKVARFYVATLPIRAVQKAITDSIETVKEFNDAMVEFNKVTSLSETQVNKLKNGLSEIGEETGNTLTNMLEIATTLTKAGLGTDTTQLETLSELVSLYQNTADEELNAADAASVLISQIKAYNFTAENAIHITDSINKVSAEFAVSSGDIGRGLTAAGAAMSTYGNTFDETVSLITAGTEIDLLQKSLLIFLIDGKFLRALSTKL